MSTKSAAALPAALREATGERFVIEAPHDSTRVRIRTVIPGLRFHPTEWIEAAHLILLIRPGVP